MAGERSWNKANAGGGKNLRIAQPLEIVTEQDKQAVHLKKVILKVILCLSFL
jgi:hypothetical protein